MIQNWECVENDLRFLVGNYIILLNMAVKFRFLQLGLDTSINWLVNLDTKIMYYISITEFQNLNSDANFGPWLAQQSLYQLQNFNN